MIDLFIHVGLCAQRCQLSHIARAVPKSFDLTSRAYVYFCHKTNRILSWCTASLLDAIIQTTNQLRFRWVTLPRATLHWTLPKHGNLLSVTPPRSTLPELSFVDARMFIIHWHLKPRCEMEWNSLRSVYLSHAQTSIKGVATSPAFQHRKAKAHTTQVRSHRA